MGEAVYYMTIRFPMGSLKKKLPEIKKFFMEGTEAYDWWQNNRTNINWKMFEKKFPQVTDYLKKSSLWKKSMAGNLDFGQKADISFINSYGTTPQGDMFYYSSLVWHFADWTPLVTYIKNHWGGSKAAWCSEENADLFPTLENHEAIVNDILKRVKDLPTLMGINKDLDELIAEHLKGGSNQ